MSMIEDITKHQKVEHRLLKVIQAFLEGHIVTVGGEDYRFAYKDQELYQQDVDDENVEVKIATESGIFKRLFSQVGVKQEIKVSGYAEVPEWADGFLWMLHSTDTMMVIKHLFDRMTEEEILVTISNLSLDHVKNNR